MILQVGEISENTRRPTSRAYCRGLNLAVFSSLYWLLLFNSYIFLGYILDTIWPRLWYLHITLRMFASISVLSCIFRCSNFLTFWRLWCSGTVDTLSAVLFCVTISGRYKRKWRLTAVAIMQHVTGVHSYWLLKVSLRRSMQQPTLVEATVEVLLGAPKVSGREWKRQPNSTFNLAPSCNVCSCAVVDYARRKVLHLSPVIR